LGSIDGSDPSLSGVGVKLGALVDVIMGVFGVERSLLVVREGVGERSSALGDGLAEATSSVAVTTSIEVTGAGEDNIFGKITNKPATNSTAMIPAPMATPDNNGMVLGTVAVRLGFG